MGEVLDTAIDNPIIASVDVTSSPYQATPIAPVDLTTAVFQVPAQATDPMYATVQPLSALSITSGSVGGAGVFDLLMAGMKAQLEVEFQNGRITGAEYTKTYIELTQTAMQTALQFVLGKDQAFWSAQAGQIASINSRVALESARYSYQNVITVQAATARIALESARFTFQNIQPAQLQLLNEQGDQARAQTSDTRLDGAGLAGVMGAQEALYRQQITSYQRDAEVKAAKLLSDAWVTQKTIDDGLVPPTCFTNDSVNQAIGLVMVNNGMGTPSA